LDFETKTIETKILLLYGEYVAPYYHREKIINKYHYYYMRDMKEPNFNLDDYYEVYIEERYTGSKNRNYYPTVGVRVKKIYFQKFIEIFKSLKGNLEICTRNHGHPIAHIKTIMYEGYCYVSDENHVFFIESFSINDNEEQSIDNIKWYKQTPENKRYIKVKKNLPFEKVFKQWIMELESFYN